MYQDIKRLKSLDFDNFDEHNLGDLRQDIHKLLDLINSREIFKNLYLLKSTLIKLEMRIDYCGHCNGVCLEHFTD